jgi:dienelactone hydrolase
MGAIRLLAGVMLAALTLASSSAHGAGGLFDYDHSAPLNVAVATATTSNGVVRQPLSYQATPSLRLSAYFMHPATGGPWPLVIWSPGAGGDRTQQLPEADRLAHGGVASLLIDAPPIKPGCRDDPLHLYVEYVVSRRRAVDLAKTLTNVDRSRIGAAGLSFGAEVTATVSGVEHRIGAIALNSGRGHYTGFVQHFCTVLGSGLDAYVAKVKVVDPVHWIGRAKGPVLIQDGTKDPLVTRSDVLALYAAASKPKELHWYVAGHGLNGAATTDRVNWLVRRLGR